ncbi:MAG: transporter [Gemmatimonadota bacterium]
MKTTERFSARLLTALTLIAGSWLVTPQLGSAQAICSAPHSSPTLFESAGNRTLPHGQGWVQFSSSFNRATETFNPFGDRQDFLANSVFHTRSAYVTAAYGIHQGVEVWAQMPIHHLRVDAANGESRKTGIGDIRTALRVSPALFGLEAPVALRLGYKVPGADFPVDATELPLTEGQNDFEASLESGWQPDALPMYVAGWAGYRWRSENTDTGHRPGNETFAHLAVGGALGTVGWQVGVDALWGETPTDQGLSLTRQQRRLIQIVPSLAAPTGPGVLELSAPIPVSGRNLPASYGLSVGYRLVFGR